jgi:hypothetical protein
MRCSHAHSLARCRTRARDANARDANARSERARGGCSCYDWTTDDDDLVCAHCARTLYVHTQKRKRSWAIDRGYAFACAVTCDGETYYAATSSERAGGETSLCAWSVNGTESERAATVRDAAKDSTCVMKFKGDGQVCALLAVVGGTLAVATSGETQLFDSRARLLHTFSADGTSRRVETVTALPASAGALVVSTDHALKKRKVLAIVESQGEKRRVEKAWEFDVTHPDGDDKARVVTAASDGETFMILWDDGLWALHDAGDGELRRKLSLDGLEVKSSTAASGKRSKTSEETSTLSDAAALSLSEDYYAIVANSKEESTVLVAVLDSRYGAVHLAEDISQSAEQSVGRTSGVCLAATSGSLVIGLSEHVLAVQFELPELSLASLVGSLSVHAKPDSNSASARILGAKSSNACTPPQHASVAPNWKVGMSKLNGQEIVSLGMCSDNWDEKDVEVKEAETRKVAETLASGSKKAAAMMKPLLKTLPISQSIIDGALRGALVHRSWEPVSVLLAEGHISGSAAAPQLMAALLEEDMLDEVKNFLLHAKDVSAQDLSVALVACLKRDTTEEYLKRRAGEAKKVAITALDEAEKYVADENQSREAKQVKIARARLLVAAYDGFQPWAQELHVLIARTLDPTLSTSVLRPLPKEQCLALLGYLLVWAKFYANSGGLFATVNTLAEPGIPNASDVVSWATALLDAQLSMFCLAKDASELVRELKDSCAMMLAMMKPLATLRGALQHVVEGSPLPEQSGVVSTTYTIEGVNW